FPADRRGDLRVGGGERRREQVMRGGGFRRLGICGHAGPPDGFGRDSTSPGANLWREGEPPPPTVEKAPPLCPRPASLTAKSQHRGLATGGLRSAGAEDQSR